MCVPNAWKHLLNPNYLSNAVVLKSKDNPEIQQSSMQAFVTLVVSYKVLKPTTAHKCTEVFYTVYFLHISATPGEYTWFHRYFKPCTFKT